MVRPKKPRFISKKPENRYFKPRAVPLANLQEIELNFEELEALRLTDLKGLTHQEASQEMNVSRPTFTRVLKSARYKVANALTNGQAIEIKGGEYKMSPRGRGVGGRGRGRGRTGGGRGRMGGPFAAGPGGNCVCTNPECGHKIAHTAGQPCYQKKCPECGSPMVRE
jgi:predicted DNA-binding protein (UPF0251 family)